ncbi:MAG: acyl carrier protein [Lachnospiraceae bacterium]|nr:acyl carrier protein [Lachnospiraceae bacterium]
MNGLKERVLIFLGEYAEIDDSVNEDSQLIADLGLSSLSVMEIVNDAEDVFSITINDDELTGLVTVGDVINLLEKKGVQ